MTHYKVEKTEEIKLSEEPKISFFKKVDDFFNKLTNLFLKTVRVWFKLLSWLVISGAIYYVYLKYKSNIFKYLYFISLISLLFFIIFSTNNLIKKQFPAFNKFRRKHAFVSSLISIISFIIVAVLSYFLIIISLGFSLP